MPSHKKQSKQAKKAKKEARYKQKKRARETTNSFLSPLLEFFQNATRSFIRDSLVRDITRIANEIPLNIPPAPRRYSSTPSSHNSEAINFDLPFPMTEVRMQRVASGTSFRVRAQETEFERNRRPIISLCPVRCEEQSGETFDLYINQKTKSAYALTQPFARFIDDGLRIRNPLFKQCDFDLQVEHQRLKEFGVDEFCFYHKEKMKFQLPF